MDRIFVVGIPGGPFGVLGVGLPLGYLVVKPLER